MQMRLTFAGAVLATLFASSAGRADSTPRGTEWGKLLSDMSTVMRRGALVLDSPRCAQSGCQTDTNATAALPERSARQANVQTTTDWFGFAPRTSLVVRDWGGTFRVAGDRLGMVDALRLTSSTRMVLTRVRLSDSRIAPFVQIGVGQWRTDPFILPLTARYTEIAGQAAAGVEMRLVGTWQVAVESAMTVLHRERGDLALPAAHMWSSTIASRIDF